MIRSLITSQWPIKRWKKYHNAVPIYFLIKYIYIRSLRVFIRIPFYFFETTFRIEHSYRNCKILIGRVHFENISEVHAKSIIDYIRSFLSLIVRLTLLFTLCTNFLLNSLPHFYIHFQISLRVCYRNRDSRVSRENVSRYDRLIAIASKSTYSVISIKIFCAECSNIFVSQRISANGQCPKNTKLA